MSGFFDGFFWVMACLGGVGAAVDFLLGKAGQRRWRGTLETWWLRFNNVEWQNLGRREAEWFLALLDRSAGAEFWSVKRAVVAIAIIFVGAVAGALISWLTARHTGVAVEIPHYWRPLFTFALVIQVILLSAAISLTRWMVSLAACYSTRKSAIIFFVILLLHVSMLFWWLPIVDLFRDFARGTLDYVRVQAISVIQTGEFSTAPLITGLELGWSRAKLYWVIFVNEGPLWQLSRHYSTDVDCEGDRGCSFDHGFGAAMRTIDYMVPLLRVILAGIFLGSFLSRPLLQKPLSLVWARVVESDKPIASLVLGGVAATAKTIQEGLKYF